MVCLLLLLLPYAAALEEDYCANRFSRLCQGKGVHVACQYPNPGPGPSCENYTQVNFDRELKHYITNYINRRRQRIAAGFGHVRGGARLPRPRIMMFVEWDRELATLAQRLADQCEFTHDDCRATTRYPYAGQTVGEVRLRRARDALNAKTAVSRVLDAWWGERRRALPRQLTEPFHLPAKGSSWGHFSQLAVWSLRAVGCGAARHGTERPRLLLVCDFSHTNMLGQRTIEPGPLAHCPGHTRRRPHSPYPLLCSAFHHDSSYEDSSEIEYRMQDEEDLIVETTTMASRRHRPSAAKRTRTTTAYVEDVSDTRRFVTVPKDAFTTIAEPFYYKVAKKMRDKVNKKEEEYGVVGINRRKEDKHRNDAIRMQSEILKQNVGTERLQYDLRTFNDWMTRKTAKKWTHSGIEDDGDQTTRYWHRKNKPYVTEIRIRLPTTLSSSLRTMRQRGNWKQTRDRPRRPGEMALLHISTTDQPVPILHDNKKTTGSLLLMDKDDVDQLFKDTGFQPAWRKIKS